MIDKKKRHEPMKMHLLELPTEILTDIFTSLSTKCKINVALTCKTLQNIIYMKKMWANVSAKLKLEYSAMKMQGNLKRLKIDPQNGWPAYIFKSLNERGIKKIVLLSINHGRFRSDMELMSKNMPCLCHLIYDKNVLQSSAEFINSIKQMCFFNIVSLGLSFNSIVDVAVIQSIVISMPHITSLNLSGCSQVNDECAKCLVGLKHLELLDLCCTSVSDIGLAFISGYKLQDGTFIHDESAPVLSKLYGLNVDQCSNITCTSWEILRNLPSLRTLITGPSGNASSSDIQHLTEMKSVRCLYIKCCMTNKALKLFSEKVCKLHSFHIPGFSIDDSGAQYFCKGFDNLFFLSLNSERITDVGVEIICQHLPQLIYLDLTACIHITDRSLKCIGEKLLNLTYLCIIRCHKITSKGLFYIPLNVYVNFSNADENIVVDLKNVCPNSEIKKCLEALSTLSVLSIKFS